MTGKVRRAKGLWLAPVLASVLLGPGCGGGGGGGGGGVTGSSGPQKSTVDNRSWNLQPLEYLAVDISITGAGNGTLDATVEWTFAANDLDIYVTAQACTAQMFESELCSYKAKADSTATKPEHVSFGVSSGDKYRFWIVNFGPQQESGTFNAILTQ